MMSKTPTALLCTTAMLLGGCAPTGQNSFCAVARPIYVSPDDNITDSTARQILDHDDIGRKLCGWHRHSA